MSKFTVVHFSDWHAMWLDVPAADLYICSGDMCPNSMGHWSDWDREVHFQKQFMKWSPIELPSKDAEVICVRGNHDHVEIAPLFPGHKVIEIINPYEYYLYENSLLSRPLAIGGMRGVKKIHGNGPDEMPLQQLDEQVKLIPALDILITHCAPCGVLDKTINPKKKDKDGEHTGSPALLKYLQFFKPILHCFGHIHEQKGVVNFEDTICSNAATGVNVIELEF